ncbi:MAG TPA: 3'-5' exonuclease, partial [bacterium]|nr:3'-5' exonuclease [bacterium]
FPIVYMVGLEEGIFPNVNSYTDSSDDIEEERRLCYVGLTRAKDKLHISYARQRRLYGSLQQNLPSRFLNEIPREFFQPAGHSQDDFEPPNTQTEGDVDIDFDVDSKKRRILFD